MKTNYNIAGKYLILITSILIISIGISVYSLKYIYDNQDKLNSFSKLESNIDSLKNLNQQIIERVQTSLDSINHFYEVYDRGEYELTYPDSILTWNQILKIDKHGNIDASNSNVYIAQLKERTRTMVLFNELNKGNYDFYINSLTEAPHISPTFGVITSSYGYRKHPVYKRRIFHRGIDIANDLGTPIYATGDGVVIKSARDYKYGRYVTIKHAKGYETKYAHLNVSYVKAGTIVYSGDVIGEMGKTGVTTGVHLHYEVIRNKKILNPYSYVNNSLRKIAKKNSVI
ncbi:M23 family metallopeptidase [bacterium]|nr:M23 family metallopeptidase [bacterium]